jgi:hypothetical protein
MNFSFLLSDSGRLTREVLDYTQDLTYLNKNLNKIFADKGKLLFGIDPEELYNVKALRK